jgi:hypothetical protein
VNSSDAVRFYLHVDKIVSASENGFNDLLPATFPSQFPLQLSEPAAVLNLVFCSFYAISCRCYKPTVLEVSVSIQALQKYGMTPGRAVNRSSPLYLALLDVLPENALQVYKLAAAYDLLDLAQVTSTHLQTYPLSSLTDVDAEEIGAIYLKRLFFLRLGRAEALKRILIMPPASHPPTLSCGTAERMAILRAWALASACVTWEAKAGKLSEN